MIIIPAQSGTYRHLQRRVTDLIAESGLTANHDEARSVADVAAAGIRPGQKAGARATATWRTGRGFGWSRRRHSTGLPPVAIRQRNSATCCTQRSGSVVASGGWTARSLCRSSGRLRLRTAIPVMPRSTEVNCPELPSALPGPLPGYVAFRGRSIQQLVQAGQEGTGNPDLTRAGPDGWRQRCGRGRVAPVVSG